MLGDVPPSLMTVRASVELVPVDGFRMLKGKVHDVAARDRLSVQRTAFANAGVFLGHF